MSEFDFAIGKVFAWNPAHAALSSVRAFRTGGDSYSSPQSLFIFCANCSQTPKKVVKCSRRRYASIQINLTVKQQSTPFKAIVKVKRKREKAKCRSSRGEKLVAQTHSSQTFWKIVKVCSQKKFCVKQGHTITWKLKSKANVKKSIWGRYKTCWLHRPIASKV